MSEYESWCSMHRMISFCFSRNGGYIWIQVGKPLILDSFVSSFLRLSVPRCFVTTFSRCFVAAFRSSHRLIVSFAFLLFLLFDFLRLWFSRFIIFWSSRFVLVSSSSDLLVSFLFHVLVSWFSAFVASLRRCFSFSFLCSEVFRITKNMILFHIIVKIVN
jgi:hypothetical protein